MASHESSRVQRKAHELEHGAEVGEREKTPLILLGETWVVCTAAFLVILALALLASRFAG
jgi:hypothetical protein